MIRLFDFTDAKYFCQPLGAAAPGVGQSLAEFHDKIGKTRMVEGSSDFQIHRVCLLNAVERWILFGVADYRRALDMLIPSGAPWAQVTLYYSSFFAANAVLGMFGAWIHIRRMVDVESGAAGSQTLYLTKKLKSTIGYRGNHQLFWELFCEGYNKFGPWIPKELQTTIAGISADPVWQINTRNEVNYDMFWAHDGALSLKKHFKTNRLTSLSGRLALQLDITEAMLKLAIYFANTFGLSSFPYEGLDTATRQVAIRRLVKQTPPNLVTQSALNELLR